MICACSLYVVHSDWYLVLIFNFENNDECKVRVMTETQEELLIQYIIKKYHLEKYWTDVYLKMIDSIPKQKSAFCLKTSYFMNK